MRQILDDAETTGGAEFPDLASLPSYVRVFFLLLLRWGVDAVMIAAELDIADHLAERPRTASELAELTGCHPESLRRILLTAAALGIFAERPDGRFILTEDAEFLRSDAEISLRDMAVFFGEVSVLNPLDELRQTLRTGVDAFQRKYGKKMYEVIGDHPALSEPFNRATTRTTRMSAESVANFGNFQRFTTVADIGGGQGRLLGEILRRHPDLRGILFDLPHVTKDAPDLLASLGVADRVAVMSGNFWDGLPAGADAYLFHRVLGIGDEYQIAKTLQRIHAEIGDKPHARLIIAEPILPPPNRFYPGHLFDIYLMLNSGGRLRTEAEWKEFLVAAGLELVSTHQAGPMATMLEARPAAAVRSQAQPAVS
jgi:O-methyltransferase domain